LKCTAYSTSDINVGKASQKRETHLTQIALSSLFGW